MGRSFGEKFFFSKSFRREKQTSKEQELPEKLPEGYVAIQEPTFDGDPKNFFYKTIEPLVSDYEYEGIPHRFIYFSAKDIVEDMKVIHAKEGSGLKKKDIVWNHLLQLARIKRSVENGINPPEVKDLLTNIAKTGGDYVFAHCHGNGLQRYSQIVVKNAEGLFVGIPLSVFLKSMRSYVKEHNCKAIFITACSEDDVEDIDVNIIDVPVLLYKSTNEFSGAKMQVYMPKNS